MRLARTVPPCSAASPTRSSFGLPTGLSPRRLNRTMAATSQRSYDDVLRLLAQLQSNKTITSLFSDPPKDKGGKDDLNAQAIPEVLAWMRRAGYDPSDLAQLRCIHVAGTKGKGSVSVLISSILAAHPSRAAGKVGTYTSPHLGTVRERIAIDGQPVSRALFTKYFSEVWDRLSQAAREAGDVVPDEDGGLDGPATKPFYFRFLTILAFHIFLKEGVKSAVIECGIGGEYDSTNVLPPEAVTATVVTQLGIDHVFMLGDTVEKIAWHKAGIFKKGVRGFTRELPPASEGVAKVLRDRAAERGASLTEIPDQAVDEWGGAPDALLQGPFQKYNMALATAAAREHLLGLGVDMDGEYGCTGYPLAQMPDYFVAGLQTASIRGRCEIFRDPGGIEWYLDGAHTHESLEGIAQWYMGRPGGPGGLGALRVLLFNQQDRDASKLLLVLLKASQSAASGEKPFHEVIFTRNDEKDPPTDGSEPARDVSVQNQCSQALQDFDKTKALVMNSVPASLKAVRGLANAARLEGRTTHVLVTGSFNLVGPVIRNLESVED
ncbi:Mur ligase [Thozetella sp. PMI_491]|nr:Mur ligase [Thozetella sp. PMI_491]